MVVEVPVVDADPTERRQIKHTPLSRSATRALGDIVTHSSSMERVHRLAERAARSSIPVLIEGERGVGKERLAHAIHKSSPRRGRPFVAVRCDAFDAARIESALFGEEGDERGGKLGAAGGGTLFLGEIGELPESAQARLALVLAENAAAMSGSDIRPIAATSRRLIDLVSQGSFHRGLFDRLNVLPIWLPPLRERRTDIPDLARSMLGFLAVEPGGPVTGGISEDALALLAAQDWPGNVGELERALLRAVMLSEGGDLVPQDFPQLLPRAAGASGGIHLAGALSMAPQTGVADQEQVRNEAALAPSARADTHLLARYGVARLLDERGEMRPIGVLEEEVIRFAIGHYRGRMSEVARRLGIGRSTLYRKIKDYGITPGEPVAS